MLPSRVHRSAFAVVHRRSFVVAAPDRSPSSRVRRRRFFAHGARSFAVFFSTSRDDDGETMRHGRKDGERSRRKKIGDDDGERRRRTTTPNDDAERRRATTIACGDNDGERHLKRRDVFYDVDDESSRAMSEARVTLTAPRASPSRSPPC
jgi:hypothetical protein